MKQNDMITKGLFAVSIVAATAVIGVVGYAKAAETTAGGSGSGYGTTSETALAAADRFDEAFGDLSGAFRVDVQTLIDETKNATKSGIPNEFEASFNEANGAYDAKVASALDTFRSQVQAAKNTAESKDQFIDAFNRAKAEYFNTLEAAKNKLADDLNRAGGQNFAKDQFMNQFNTLKDAYGNELEQIKNDFAATLG